MRGWLADLTFKASRFNSEVIILLAVTGADGYLGGALAAAATDPSLALRLMVRRPAPWLPVDPVQVGSLEAAATGGGFDGADAVVHLAGPNEVVTASDPVGALASAVSAAHAVALGSANSGVRRLVYVSTVHVYGAALAPGAAVSEVTVPEPRHPYAAARLTCEHVIKTAARDVDVVILRLTNAVGPPVDVNIDRWSLVANDLCRQAVSEGSLRLLTDGQQWRDFVALNDVCGIVLAAAGGRIPAGTYNLGSGRPLKVRDLARIVQEQAAALGLGELPLIAPAPSGDPTQPYTVDVSKLANLGFDSRMPIEEPVADILRFCKDQLR